MIKPQNTKNNQPEGIHKSQHNNKWIVRVKSGNNRTPLTNCTQADNEQIAWQMYHEYYDRNLHLERLFNKPIAG